MDKPFGLETMEWNGKRWTLREKKNPSKLFCSTAWCHRSPLHGRKCRTCDSRLWRANNPEKYAFVELRRRAKARGIPFELSFGDFQFIIAHSDYIKNKSAKSKFSPTIDRKEADKGYTLTNCQILTRSENSTKRLTVDYPNPSQL